MTSSSTTSWSPCPFSLFMCMGLGCHAVGVTGCRIVDSKRERLIAMLTNALVPCNGRLPTLIALCTLFFATGKGVFHALGISVALSLMILLSVLATLGCSKLLSLTFLKGTPSGFCLELPPYRVPRIGQVLVRSAWDRTLRVLGRAVLVAAPAGLILWLLANVSVGNVSLLSHLASTLDPVGRALGMDGAILLGFLLALPANEIVLPVILMTYTSSGGLFQYESAEVLKEMLVGNGWSTVTALCVCVFMLFHYPCATSLWTIKRESGMTRYALLAAILPTLLGILLCFLIFQLSILFV